MAKSSVPFDDPVIPHAEPVPVAKKPRKKAVRTPLSSVMMIAGQIDRLLNRLPENERRRALNVVQAAQSTLPLT